jgi:putative lipoic acid-binding regulatory protein
MFGLDDWACHIGHSHKVPLRLVLQLSMLPVYHYRLLIVASLLNALSVVSAWLNTRLSLDLHRGRGPWSSDSFLPIRRPLHIHIHAQNDKNDDRPSGSFFNPVPDQDDDADAASAPFKSNSNNNGRLDDDDNEDDEPSSSMLLESILRDRRRPSRAMEPSTINGVPSHQAPGMGFSTPSQQQQQQQPATARTGTTTTSTTISSRTSSSSTSTRTIRLRDGVSKKPYVAIGPVLNDVTKPEYDDQGYTLYADETTGKRSRVFEALVDYPCLFTIKIVGAHEGGFLPDMLSIVAATCCCDKDMDVDVDDIQHSVKRNGKWTSITVQAPVANAAMLYQLYENIDKDPRVRFKF